MTKDELKQKLSEVAEWRQPRISISDVKRGAQKARGKGRPSREEMYEEEHEQVFAELFKGINPTHAPELVRVHIQRVDCEDCGRLEEYVGNKIKYLGEDAIWFTQPVLLQSFNDKFELPTRCYYTPAQPGTVLRKTDEDALTLSAKEQLTLRSGIGKLMYIMQFWRPYIALPVRDLARYMT
jgi:hypothetical protein